ncbi:very-long-chain 3-oxoacyl-CoA reductase-like protein [Tanacetum coccineum]
MVKKTSLFTPTPDEYVKAAVRHIGYESRCTPYWPHSIQWFFASLAPDFLLDAWRLSIGIKRQTGDWDILSAALAVAVVEGIGALMYTGSFPLIIKVKNLITLFNYWKGGLTMGLFLDSFKY